MGLHAQYRPLVKRRVRFIDEATLARLLPPGPLVAALREAFRIGCESPLRTALPFDVPGEPTGTLLFMPAWRPGGLIGVKLVTVVPGNGARGLNAVNAVYLTFDAATGRPLAALDGEVLTARRTAAASALAADYLARPDAGRLLIVGTGRVARELAGAHGAVRALDRVAVWGRDPAKAAALADALAGDGHRADVAPDLARAVEEADIVSCATLSRDPLLRGAWVRPGTHIDLIGGFRPDMRESDDALIAKAALFVDTHAGALAEAGDLTQPIADGVIAADAVRADLAALCRGDHPGRESAAAITLFKSVGTALEDLAAADLALAGGPDP